MIKELDEYVQGYYDGVPDIGYMLNENPDCKYSGTLYRCVFLDDGLRDDIINQFYPVNMNQVFDIIKKHMYKPYEYCSFTKYQGIADDWANDIEEPRITIKVENEGLDVEVMVDKWENYIDEQYMEYLQDYKSESEVICKMKNDFEIITICNKYVDKSIEFNNENDLLNYFKLR